MPNYTTQDIRNIALVGQGAAGKTTLTEALLHSAGQIPTAGTVERGDTVCDFDPQEKEYQHSLYASLASFDHAGRHLNLLDTPGLSSFVGRAISVFPAVETAAVVIDAPSGVQTVSQRMMHRADDSNLCRMIIVNKIDGPNLDLEKLVSQIQESFGSVCLPINLPADGGTKVIDCFANDTGETDFSSVSDAHSLLIDQIVEVDDELMERYLEGEELSADDMKTAFSKALCTGHIVPICFVSARTGAGVPELLDSLTNLAPDPTQATPHEFSNAETDEKCDVLTGSGGSTLAHVFKVSVDPFLGTLSVFRVHRGSIKKDSRLLLSGSSKPIKIGHLFSMQGKKHTDLPACVAGDICATAKLDQLKFDTLLHEAPEDGPLRVDGTSLPKPMYGLAVTAKTRAHEQKLGPSLRKLELEDPCLEIVINSETKETVLQGLTEHHLRIALEKMKDQFHVEVDTKPPRIQYRETITKPASGHHRHKKQTGGAGQFGEVYLKIEPLERGTGFQFESKVVGGVIPSQFIPAVEKGVRQVLVEGTVAGYPLQDIKVTVYDGKHHPVDSKEVAFVSAARRAFQEAIMAAGPVVLEPIVSVAVTAPDEHIGDITGGLASKRGQIKGTSIAPNNCMTVESNLPLSELTNYTAELKSMTSGQGSYIMDFSHYEPMPRDSQEKLVAAYKRADED